MARPRKPTSVLEATGAFQKNPQRRRARANEPISNGPVGDPPAYFSDDLAALWNELKAEAPPGVLHKSDCVILEMTVLLFYKFRHAPEHMPVWLEKLGDVLRAKGVSVSAVRETQRTLFQELRMSASEKRIMASCFGKMGMTPTGRTRVVPI